jgi:hypothetical protein
MNVEQKDLKLGGVVENGILKIMDRKAIHEYTKTLEHGTQVELVIKPIKDFRSLKLNRTYWMYLTMIGEHLGHSKMEMHDYFKAKFLCEVHVVNGEETLVCQSTAKLTNKEFCIYLEDIFQFCSEKIGYVLPDIDEIRQIKKEL